MPEIQRLASAQAMMIFLGATAVVWHEVSVVTEAAPTGVAPVGPSGMVMIVPIATVLAILFFISILGYERPHQ
jgi:xanthine/uracil/vitamin C permease (AzgA family)